MDLTSSKVYLCTISAQMKYFKPSYSQARKFCESLVIVKFIAANLPFCMVVISAETNTITQYSN